MCVVVVVIVVVVVVVVVVVIVLVVVVLGAFARNTTKHALQKPVQTLHCLWLPRT